MKRLTARNNNNCAYYPHCFGEDSCFGFGASEKCNRCKFSHKVCERLTAYEETGLSPKQIREMKEKIPTTDVKCHWKAAIGYDQKKNVQCSNCHLMSYEPTNYCPHCGAKMDGGDE